MKLFSSIVIATVVITGVAITLDEEFGQICVNFVIRLAQEWLPFV